MIESEALKKWCPMTRVAKIERGRVPFGQVAANRLQADDGDTVILKASYCLGSKCMLWRAGQNERLSGAPEAKLPTGHCGLAGAE